MAFGIPFEFKGARLILPLDAEIVQDSRKFLFHMVGKAGTYGLTFAQDELPPVPGREARLRSHDDPVSGSLPSPAYPKPHSGPSCSAFGTRCGLTRFPGNAPCFWTLESDRKLSVLRFMSRAIAAVTRASHYSISHSLGQRTPQRVDDSHSTIQLVVPSSDHSHRLDRYDIGLRPMNCPTQNLHLEVAVGRWP